MKRKITKHGPSSLTISLPSKWVKKNNLKPGQELEVVAEDYSLNIHVIDRQPTIKRAKLNFDDLDAEGISYILPLAHKKGYDELEITYKIPGGAKTIQRRINEMLMGYEIVESSSNRCVVKNISTDSEDEFGNMIKRLFQVTITLCTEMQASFDAKGKPQLEDALTLEKTNNKLSNYCERLLVKDLVGGENKVFYYLVVWQLENIGDYLREMCHLLIGGLKLTDRTKKLFEKMKKLIEDYNVLYFNFSDKEVIRLKKEVKAVKKETKAEMVQKIQIDFLAEMLNVIDTVENLFSSAVAINYKW